MAFTKRILNGVESVISNLKSWANQTFSPKSHKHTKSDITDFPTLTSGRELDFANAYTISLGTSGLWKAPKDGIVHFNVRNLSGWSEGAVYVSNSFPSSVKTSNTLAQNRTAIYNDVYQNASFVSFISEGCTTPGNFGGHSATVPVSKNNWVFFYEGTAGTVMKRVFIPYK